MVDFDLKNNAYNKKIYIFVKTIKRCINIEMKFRFKKYIIFCIILLDVFFTIVIWLNKNRF